MAATHDEETNRLEKLGMFLSAFAPKSGEEMSFGPAADDQFDQALILARDKTLLDAFDAIGRIARASFPPPRPKPAPKPKPAARVEPKVGRGAAKTKAAR